MTIVQNLLNQLWPPIQYVAVAEELDVPKSKFRTCIDSGASRDYCPDWSKFIMYRNVQQKITTADGRTLNAIGMGNLQLELPNSSGKTVTIFKDAIHTPEMAFTLISISRLDRAGFLVTFSKEMCTIKNPKSTTIATIPHSDGLYKITASKCLTTSEMANAAAGKMSITEAHRKLGHILISAIKHAVSKGFITGIDLNPDSKFEFCEACAKAKSADQPFPKESNTRATRFGERVHWDLWGPASVKSINGNHYVTARIDDSTKQTKLYFQVKKSQTIQSYKKNKAYIKNQTRKRIKISRSDRRGEFLSD
jgi:GAG-pre-integrase domain